MHHHHPASHHLRDGLHQFFFSTKFAPRIQTLTSLKKIHHPPNYRHWKNSPKIFTKIIPAPDVIHRSRCTEFFMLQLDFTKILLHQNASITFATSPKHLSTKLDSSLLLHSHFKMFSQCLCAGHSYAPLVSPANKKRSSLFVGPGFLCPQISVLRQVTI